MAAHGKERKAPKAKILAHQPAKVAPAKSKYASKTREELLKVQENFLEALEEHDQRAQVQKPTFTLTCKTGISNSARWTCTMTSEGMRDDDFPILLRELPKSVQYALQWRKMYDENGGQMDVSVQKYIKTKRSEERRKS